MAIWCEMEEDVLVEGRRQWKIFGGVNTTEEKDGDDLVDRRRNNMLEKGDKDGLV